jgi:hypothetical protein
VPPVAELREVALAQLTAEDVRACVVYLATPPVADGESLTIARLTFSCPWEAYLVFVDLDPGANWGHRCCYLCIDAERGRAHRIDAQLPPFGPRTHSRAARAWQVIYRAPGVPEALLAVPAAEGPDTNPHLNTPRTSGERHDQETKPRGR